MSRPEAGSLISRSAARNASVDDVAISLLHPVLVDRSTSSDVPGSDMAYDVRHANGPSTRGSTEHKMPWNNNGPSPWGNPGGNQGGGPSGGQGGGGDGDGQQPPHGPWGGGGGDDGNRGGRRGGPFGGGPFGPNGPFSDLEGLIRQVQAFVRNLLPGGRGVGVGGLTMLIAVVV